MPQKNSPHRFGFGQNPPHLTVWLSPRETRPSRGELIHLSHLAAIILKGGVNSFTSAGGDKPLVGRAFFLTPLTRGVGGGCLCPLTRRPFQQSRLRVSTASSRMASTQPFIKPFGRFWENAFGTTTPSLLTQTLGFHRLRFRSAGALLGPQFSFRRIPEPPGR